MKKLFYAWACLATFTIATHAQELQDPHWISDFENDQALYWNPIANAQLEVVDNPFLDDNNPSNKVLQLTLPKGETYAGAIITVDDLPVGDAPNHYRYAQIKVYKPQSGTTALKLQKGPNDISREIAKAVQGGTWQELTFDFNFNASDDAVAIGTYGEVFVIGHMDTYEGENFVMYIDDIRFTNTLPQVDDGLPETTDELAVLDNFENGRVNFSDLLQPMEEATMQVVDNPSPDDTNPSRKVLEITRPNDKPAWIGFFAHLNSKAAPKCDMDKYRYVHVKLLQDIPCDTASFKVEGGNEIPQLEVKVKPTKINEWEELIFDLHDAKGLYPIIALMPDYDNNRPTHSVYVDDIQFLAGEQDPETDLDITTIASSLWIESAVNEIIVHFVVDKPKVMTIRLFTATGQTLATHTIKTTIGENILPITLDEQGVLLLQLSAERQTIVTKFQH